MRAGAFGISALAAAEACALADCAAGSSSTGIPLHTTGAAEPDAALQPRRILHNLSGRAQDDAAPRGADGHGRAGEMSAVPTIDEMLRVVPEGERRLFEAPVQGAVEDRFFSVLYNYDRGDQPDWRSGLSLERAPWMGSRQKARIPISVLPPTVASFAGKADELADFYAYQGNQVHFVSDRLLALIERLDPGSLDHRPVTIEAADRAVDFYLVMPARHLDAVDPQRTNLLIKDEKIGSHWARRLRFPDGVVFREGALAGVHSFSDRNARGWFWSRELIDAAKAAKITGLRTMRAGMITGPTIDRL